MTGIHRAGRSAALGASLLAAASITLATTSVAASANSPHVAAASSSATHTLVHKDGHGNGRTKTFHVAGHWHYDWGFNCGGSHKGFTLQVRHKDGSPDNAANWVFRNGSSASGHRHQHADGHLYLKVITDCHWHVKVVGHSSSSSPPPAQHACTRTSSGTCIQGGEFCPEADYGQYGYDAQGRKYVCTGDPSHPHWEVP